MQESNTYMDNDDMAHGDVVKGWSGTRPAESKG